MIHGVCREQILAERAAKMVEVEYEDLPAVLTIPDAIANNSFSMEECLCETVAPSVETASPSFPLTRLSGL